MWSKCVLRSMSPLGEVQYLPSQTEKYNIHHWWGEYCTARVARSSFSSGKKPRNNGSYIIQRRTIRPLSRKENLIISKFQAIAIKLRNAMFHWTPWLMITSRSNFEIPNLFFVQCRKQSNVILTPLISDGEYNVFFL